MARRLGQDARARIDRERERHAILLQAVAEVAALQRVPVGHRAGQLAPRSGDRCPPHRTGCRSAAAASELVESSQRPAPKNQRRLRMIGPPSVAWKTLLSLSGRVVSLSILERVLVAPRRVGEVGAEAAGERVAAALGDGVDDAAGEAAVLGRDAGGDDLRLLDRVLDEEIVGAAEEVVVDVDAVDQEDVVVGERARDAHLIGVRRVGGEPGGELGDVGERAAGRQRVDFAARCSWRCPTGSPASRSSRRRRARFR